jgi:hypothetical protein
MTAAAATTPLLERRRERRVPVHLPILVRGTDRGGDWFEEQTASQNVCRGGVSFSTQYSVELGGRLEISIPNAAQVDEDDREFSTQGRIVHVKSGRTDRELIVGVEFTGPRFHRIFVSEAT